MNEFRILAILFLLIFSCSSEKSKKDSTDSYIFNRISSDESGVDFSNFVTEDEKNNIINYIYFYNGAGVAAGDVNNDGLPDLFFVSNQEDNKLYINKGDFKFEDVTSTANLTSKSTWNTGTTMIDINNDGLLDIYVCSVSGLLDFEGRNELFINNGDGTFTEDAESYGLDFKGYSTQAYFFDYDKDDDLDVYIVNHAVHTTLSHGRADIRNEREPLVGDVLLNNDNGKFKDVSEAANIYGGVNSYGLSATIADFNNDGWDDIYVCNDFHEDDYYYINNQDGTFSEKLDNSFTTISRFSMGSDASDINGDGYQDLITLDMLPKEEIALKETEGDDAMFNMQVHLKNLGYKDQFSRNMLQISNEGKFFYEAALFNEIADTDWSWAPLLADLNNDGHQDLYISNGILRRPNNLDFKKYVSSAFKNRTEAEGVKWLYNSISEMPNGIVANEIFKGDSRKFSNKTGDWIENKPQLSNGVIYVDLDLDGDLDLVTNNFNEEASLYQNSVNNTSNYIDLTFSYKSGNKEGIGTKVLLYEKNRIQSKQLFKSRGFMSSLEGKVHFGLNDLNSVDSIKVIWPNNEFTTIENPEINKTHTIGYKASSKYTYQSAPQNLIFKEEDLINFSHKEDIYNDFAEEKLIPYKVSTFGPAIAIGDIDGNGFEDIFIGNSSGKSAKIYLNSGYNLKESSQPEIEGDLPYEDNSATFFDADKDGDLDLYVGSGINVGKLKPFELDRLYLNENGVFKKSKQGIPDNPFITTVVIANDYDKDGDQDLFIGNHSERGNFGQTIPSYLLINDGKGNFEKDQSFNLNSMVTSALWEDINGDGWADLLVSTEWDKPHLYVNREGRLEENNFKNGMTGLWQSITAFDIDKDGDKDILLGNWGLNTKFNLNFDGPLNLYYSDYDNNGKFETILAYNNDGEYFPLHTKDEMASQMNVLNKIYTNHQSYAGKTVRGVMGDRLIDEAKKYEAQVLASGYIRNDNGVFTDFIEFNNDFQLAPINSFGTVIIENEEQLIIGGNSFKGNTYHGSYAAQKGLLVKTESDYDRISAAGMNPFNSQIKAIKQIKMKTKSIIMVLSNNDELTLYSLSE